MRLRVGASSISVVFFAVISGCGGNGGGDGGADPFVTDGGALAPGGGEACFPPQIGVKQPSGEYRWTPILPQGAACQSCLAKWCSGQMSSCFGDDWASGHYGGACRSVLDCRLQCGCDDECTLGCLRSNGSLSGNSNADAGFGDSLGGCLACVVLDVDLLCLSWACKSDCATP